MVFNIFVKHFPENTSKLIVYNITKTGRNYKHEIYRRCTSIYIIVLKKYIQYYEIKSSPTKELWNHQSSLVLFDPFHADPFHFHLTHPTIKINYRISLKNLRLVFAGKPLYKYCSSACNSFHTHTWGGVSYSYCSLKPLWSGIGEVVPARISLTRHPPSPPTLL